MKALLAPHPQNPTPLRHLPPGQLIPALPNPFLLQQHLLPTVLLRRKVRAQRVQAQVHHLLLLVLQVVLGLDLLLVLVDSWHLLLICF